MAGKKKSKSQVKAKGSAKKSPTANVERRPKRKGSRRHIEK